MAIEITGKLKPKGVSGFSLMDAEDIEYKNGRLPDFLFQCLTEEEYRKLEADGKLSETTPYLIIDERDGI